MIPIDLPARTYDVPIAMHINVRLKAQTDPPWLNFNATDWKEFRKEISLRLENLETGDVIPTVLDFPSHVDKLTSKIGLIHTQIDPNPNPNF